jgi:hypothetical protein
MLSVTLEVKLLVGLHGVPASKAARQTGRNIDSGIDVPGFPEAALRRQPPIPSSGAWRPIRNPPIRLQDLFDNPQGHDLNLRIADLSS